MEKTAVIACEPANTSAPRAIELAATNQTVLTGVLVKLFMRYSQLENGRAPSRALKIVSREPPKDFKVAEAKAYKAKDWRDAASIYNNMSHMSHHQLRVGGKARRQTMLEPIIY